MTDLDDDTLELHTRMLDGWRLALHNSHTGWAGRGEQERLLAEATRDVDNLHRPGEIPGQQTLPD